MRDFSSVRLPTQVKRTLVHTVDGVYVYFIIVLIIKNLKSLNSFFNMFCYRNQVKGD
jgi:hypothetical protein